MMCLMPDLFGGSSTFGFARALPRWRRERHCCRRLSRATEEFPPCVGVDHNAWRSHGTYPLPMLVAREGSIRLKSPRQPRQLRREWLPQTPDGICLRPRNVRDGRGKSAGHSNPRSGCPLQTSWPPPGSFDQLQVQRRERARCWARQRPCPHPSDRTSWDE